MHKHTISAWVLRHFLSAGSAEAVLGDLAETHGAETQPYRAAIRRSARSVLWRFAATYLAAAVSGLACLFASLISFSYAASSRLAPWPHAFSLILMLSTVCFAITSTFYVLRYGIQDAWSASALILNVGMFIAVEVSWIYLWLGVALLAAALGITALRNRSHLQSFAALLALAVAQTFAWYLFMFGGSQSEVRFVVNHGRLGKLFFLTTSSGIYLGIALLCCVASAATRRWSQRTQAM